MSKPRWTCSPAESTWGSDKPTQAYQFFLDAVNNYPFSPDSYSMLVDLVNNNVPVDDLNRGLVDYSAGQYGFARDAFQRYINANPKNDGTAAYYHAMTFIQLGDYQQGISRTHQLHKFLSGKQKLANRLGRKSRYPMVRTGRLCCRRPNVPGLCQGRPGYFVCPPGNAGCREKL